MKRIFPGYKSRWFIFTAPAIVITVISIFVLLEFFPGYRDLVILFVYSIPSEFLIGIIPHEPIILYYGKFYHPLSVTVMALAGTLVAEYTNYMIVDVIFRIKKLQEFKNRKTSQKLIKYFLKAPFIAIVVAAFTPVPFYPFRILSGVSKYSIYKYLLAITVGRSPRYYLLSLSGIIVPLPNTLIVVIFLILFAIGLYSVVRSKIGKSDSLSVDN